MSRITEYDDGFDSRTSFERADEDRPEDLDSAPVGLVDCEPTVGDVFGWLDDDQLARSIGRDIAQALNLESFEEAQLDAYQTTHGQKTAAGLARLVWALIHDALPNR